MGFLSADSARELARLAALEQGETGAAPLERLRGIRSLVTALEADPASTAAPDAAERQWTTRQRYFSATPAR